MADYVLARKSRNIASSVMHVVLNLLLGLGAVYSTVLLKTPALGIVLVLVSKWRVLMVRMRFWWPNIKANLVDVIVGISIVLLTYYMQPASWLPNLLMAALYCIWLTLIKPLTSERAALIQALAAVFFGMSAVSIGTTRLDAITQVLPAFVIGYAASRHILTQSEDQDFTLTTLTIGLVFAEVAWLCSAWSIVYPIGEIPVPQVAVILTIFTLVYNYVRQAVLKYRDDLQFKHILGPVLFGVVLIGIIVLGFSNPMFNV